MSDNPSAFPHDLLRDDDAYPTHDASPGMSLRDWFAGQALAGYFAHPTTPHQNATDGAAYCYAMADAMLAARTGGA